jgi:hypothetical protein
MNVYIAENVSCFVIYIKIIVHVCVYFTIGIIEKYEFYETLSFPQIFGLWYKARCCVGNLKCGALDPILSISHTGHLFYPSFRGSIRLKGYRVGGGREVKEGRNADEDL